MPSDSESETLLNNPALDAGLLHYEFAREPWSQYSFHGIGCRCVDKVDLIFIFIYLRFECLHRYYLVNGLFNKRNLYRSARHLPEARLS